MCVRAFCVKMCAGLLQKLYEPSHILQWRCCNTFNRNFLQGKFGNTVFFFPVLMTSRVREELLATPCILYSYRELSVWWKSRRNWQCTPREGRVLESMEFHPISLPQYAFTSCQLSSDTFIFCMQPLFIRALKISMKLPCRYNIQM